ncbi:hypothetical protein PRUPE_4G070800 [Prunus persica]|uniref:GDSL esterase/lipase n=1 Tax=Prunus persica TaxID=3760 RepID=M5WKJ6_PRUPE|nr:hypothetical protein PRUPE_4G070800 [Prunus persica]
MAKVPTILFMMVVVLVDPIHGAPQVPCFFIFGDSLVDNGNNNNLLTRAKVNYQPYGIGIDFLTGPTGRFCNGRTTVDILAQLLGFENLIPPFATSNKGPDILKGLNYASGATGIRVETGSQLGGHISLDQQLLNHQVTAILYTYKKKKNTTSPDEISSAQVHRPMPTKKSMPTKFRRGKPNPANFVGIDLCRRNFVARVNNIGQCAAGQTPCQNRSEYVFWDGFHPTEALNQITGIRTYTAFDPSDAYPMGISHLVQLRL